MNAYLDYKETLLDAVKDKDIKRVLEFGLGEGTGILVSIAESVHSVELLAYEENKDWFDEVTKKYSGSSYSSELIECKDKLTPKLKERLQKIIDQGWDLIFVDPGVHFRGDLVNMSFGRAEIILAHDTNMTPELYGWNKIKVPSNYEQIGPMDGQGTTVWRKK